MMVLTEPENVSLALDYGSSKWDEKIHSTIGDKLKLYPFMLDGLIKSLKINNSSFYNDSFFHSDFCDKADMYFGDILTPDSSYYRRGYLVYVNNDCLGFIKFKGDRTFLSWRTVLNPISYCYDLVLGRMYEVKESLIEKLENKKCLKNNNWGVVNLSSLDVFSGRFIDEDVNRFYTMPWLTKEPSIEEKILIERELVENLFRGGKL